MSLILSGTDGLSDVDGSAATPAIRGTDANTGMFFPAADTIAFSEGGVESMRLNSSGVLVTTNDASISGLTVGKGGGAISTNTAVGLSALGNNTTGSEIVAVGENALSSNTTGAANVAVGRFALGTNTTGAGNLAVGSRQNGVTDSPLRQNTTGNYNIALGNGVLRVNTTGSNNVGVGFDSLQSNTTASNNTAVGFQAMYSNTTGTDNTAVGYGALYTNTTSLYNTAVGRDALRTGTGARNTAIGAYTQNNQTTGASNTSVGVGGLNSNTTGSFNTAIGDQSLIINTTASNNTAVGYQAGYSNNTSESNAFYGRGAGYSANTGGLNTFIGDVAGYFVTTGAQNTILGRYNGNQGGLDIRTASNYIVLSDGAGNPRFLVDNNAAGYLNTVTRRNSGMLSIDYNGNVAGGMGICDVGSANSSAYIGFLSGGTFRGSINNNNNAAVAYNTTSDYRLKENIVLMTGALSQVAQLKPCTYTWKETGDASQGFIAHELAEVCPDAVTGEKDAVDVDGNPKYQGVDTSFLVATLTAAIQELNQKVEAQALEIAQLKGN